jgi:ribonuclease inhibitor
MIAEIDGSKIRSEADFHNSIAETLRLPCHYGKNLDALWDVLSTGVERPLRIIWRDSYLSQAAMPECFAKIVEVLRRVERQDMEWNLPEAERLDVVLS